MGSRCVCSCRSVAPTLSHVRGAMRPGVGPLPRLNAIRWDHFQGIKHVLCLRIDPVFPRNFRQRLSPRQCRNTTQTDELDPCASPNRSWAQSSHNDAPRPAGTDNESPENSETVARVVSNVARELLTRGQLGGVSSNPQIWHPGLADRRFSMAKWPGCQTWLPNRGSF
jgi:hypothetical protein